MVSDALILITAMLAGWAVHLINDIGHFGYGFVPDQSFDYASMCEAAVKHQIWHGGIANRRIAKTRNLEGDIVGFVFRRGGRRGISLSMASPLT